MKKNLFSIGLAFSVILGVAFSFGFVPQEATVSVTYQGGYCTNGTDVWVACNFPKGPCKVPQWCNFDDH